MAELPALSRRSFVLGASAALAVTQLPPVGSAAPAPAGTLPELSAVEAVGAMSRGEIAVEAYATALLARCAKVQALNAFITLEPERVLEAAQTSANGKTKKANDPTNVRELRRLLDEAVASGKQIPYDKPLVTRLI